MTSGDRHLFITHAWDSIIKIYVATSPWGKQFHFLSCIDVSTKGWLYSELLFLWGWLCFCGLKPVTGRSHLRWYWQWKRSLCISVTLAWGWTRAPSVKSRPLTFSGTTEPCLELDTLYRITGIFWLNRRMNIDRGYDGGCKVLWNVGELLAAVSQKTAIFLLAWNLTYKEFFL